MSDVATKSEGGFNCTYCGSESANTRFGRQWCEECGSFHANTITYVGIITEGIINIFVDSKRELNRWMDILRGNVEENEHTCQMKGCDKNAVAKFSYDDGDKEYLNVCRRDWVIDSLIQVGMYAMLFGFVLGSIALTVYFG